MPLDDANWPSTTETEVTDETSALLIRARAFLERGWCRGSLAQDANAYRINPTSENARMWCASGALRAAGFATGSISYLQAQKRLREAVNEPIQKFNDRQTTVEPVLAAFDRAIAMEG